jgi:hypothetical protein
VRLCATAPVRLVGPLHVVSSPCRLLSRNSVGRGAGQVNARSTPLHACDGVSACATLRGPADRPGVRCRVRVFARSRACPRFKRSNCYPHLWITVCVTTEELPCAR